MAVNSAANFNSVRLGFFVNDDIKVSDKFTLTIGIRADKTCFTTDVPTDKFFNDTARAVIASVYNIEGAVSGGKFQPIWQFSPRIGFKANFDEEQLTLVEVLEFLEEEPRWYGRVVFTKIMVLPWCIGCEWCCWHISCVIEWLAIPFRPDVNNQYTQSDFGLAPSQLNHRVI